MLSCDATPTSPVQPGEDMGEDMTCVMVAGQDRFDPDLSDGRTLDSGGTVSSSSRSAIAAALLLMQRVPLL